MAARKPKKAKAKPEPCAHTRRAPAKRLPPGCWKCADCGAVARARTAAVGAAEVLGLDHGQRFAAAMRRKWRTVHYDEKSATGYADSGSLGRIHFQRSGNDPAVIVTIPAIRVKGDSASAVEWLDALGKLLHKLD